MALWHCTISFTGKCLFTALMSFGFDLATISETMVYWQYYPLFNKNFGVFSRRYSKLILLDTQLANIHIFQKEEELNWAPSSEFVSSSIPSWQILTAHAQPFRGARDLAFCLKVLLDSLLVWASSEGSGETARMRRLAWTFAARIGDKYQIRLARPNLSYQPVKFPVSVTELT